VVVRAKRAPDSRLRVQRALDSRFARKGRLYNLAATRNQANGIEIEILKKNPRARFARGASRQTLSGR
jgi:hypothetical protein